MPVRRPIKDRQDTGKFFLSRFGHGILVVAVISEHLQLWFLPPQRQSA